jgi:hypothetical protein
MGKVGSVPCINHFSSFLLFKFFKGGQVDEEVCHRESWAGAKMNM